VFYAQGGFNQKAKPDQRRFLMESCEEYFNLVNDCQKLVAKEKNVKIGMGIHSLRAATPEQVIKIFDHYKNSKKMVKHIHIAEQLKEVVDCQQFLGQRPIEWLLNNVSVDASFHLVHATHLSDHEKKLIIQSGAHVVLCPSTEASLGDGFFPFTDFFKNGGNFSIGSDSQVVINPLEELRWLDFAQRSMLKKRNILCQKAQQESGDLIYLGALKGGRNALGLNPDKLMEIGQPFYALVSRGSDLFFELKPDKFFSTQIYAPALSGADKNLGGAFIAGKWTAF
jgi:formimidoylglutamate deiminase